MINLLMCGNNKVFDGMMIAFLSLIKHNKAEVNAYILTMDLQEIHKNYIPISDSQAIYLENILKQGNNNSKVILVDMTDNFKKDMLESVNLKNMYTPYAMLRLFADQIEDVPDKLLYFDTDIAVNGDLVPLYETDMYGYEFAGCYDALGRFFIRYDYINTGVLLLNVKEMIKTDLFNRTRKMCNAKKMAFPDQTALNRLAKSKKFLPMKYNLQRGRMRRDTVIRHFCKTIKWLPFFHLINIKPWHVKKVHKVLKINEFDEVLADYQKRALDLQNSIE